MVAIVIPDYDVVENWIKQQEECKIGTSHEEICESAEISKLILAQMNELATSAKFNGLERVKKLYLHPEEFTEKNGMLTPS